MKQEITLRSGAAEYLTYITATGESQGVEAVYADENVWLSQKMMAMLYAVKSHTINYHLKKIFQDAELDEKSVARNFRVTASDGKQYQTKHFNLKAIIAVGNKVNSSKAVQFRKLQQLNRMVSAYLDYAEDMAKRKIPLTMEDWEKRLNRFIEMFEYGLLKDVGKVTAEIARLHALSEFEKYRITQDKEYVSDFDKFVLENAEGVEP